MDPGAVIADDYYDEPDEEIKITRSKTFFVKVMSPEEAVMQMNMLGHTFFMFRNDENGEVNVVYRRKDGDYGLLAPEGK